MSDEGARLAEARFHQWITMTLRAYFRTALLAPLVLPIVIGLCMWVELPLPFATSRWVRRIDDGLQILILSAVFYGPPYALFVRAIWRRSSRWPVRRFLLLLSGLPSLFAVGLLAILQIRDATIEAWHLLAMALAVGYGFAIWRRSRAWPVRQYWWLVGALPAVLAAGLVALLASEQRIPGIWDLLRAALVIGYGQALLIAGVALVGRLLGWLVDSEAAAPSTGQGAHVA